MKMILLCDRGARCAFLGLAPAGWAATATTTFAVTGTVVPSRAARGSRL